MSRLVTRSRSTAISNRVVVLAATLTVWCVSEVAAQNARGMPDGFEFTPRDLVRELSNKMTGTYTVTAVGDVLMQEPMTNWMSPELLEILRRSDTTVGNMEIYLVDRRNWTHGFGNNWAPKEMAQEFVNMGFDMLLSGEGAGGEDGMRSSMHWLDQVGIPLAGYGANLAAARQPVFQPLNKGRVAMVGAYPVMDDADWAEGMEGESYGLNPMRLTAYPVVDPTHFSMLKEIQDAIVARRHDPDVSRPIAVPREPADNVTIFNTTYRLGSRTGEWHYEVNPGDRRGNVLAVRNAKEYADFVIFSMHDHSNRYAFQAYSQDHYPVDYLPDLMRDMVDNGMDMYVGSGNHTMQGIEIYKGRPIFYNLGNFSVHRFGADDSGNAGPMTAIERGEAANQWLQQPANQRAYVARITYQDGFLEEIRIYPVDLGGDRRPWSRTDVPMKPEPTLAREILSQVQEYSRPFGTTINIENDPAYGPIGVIRVQRSATVPVGGEIRGELSTEPR